MSEKYRKFYLTITEKILPVVSYFFIVLSMGLEIAARKSMGINRDLVFRKGVLENTVLNMDILEVYKWLVLAGIGVCIYFIILKKANIIRRVKKYIFLALGFSIVFLIMIISYDKVGLVAYPWAVMSVGITVICQYIRMINWIVNGYK